MLKPRRALRKRAALRIIIATMLAVACPPLQGAQAEQAAPPASDRSSATEWTFNDVDVAVLTRRLRSIGLSIPVELEGRVSAALSVDVPWTQLRDTRAWRLDGTLTSQELKIEGVTVTDLAVRIEYKDGNLTLHEMEVRVPDEEAADPTPAGFVSGEAVMELVPSGKFTASLEVEDVPIAAASRAVEDAPPASGLLSGSLSAEVDVNDLRDLSAWKVDGPVTVRQFALRTSPPVDASVQLRLADGVVTAGDFSLLIAESEVSGRGTLGLTGEQDWTIEAAVQSEDLRPLLELLAQLPGGAEFPALGDTVTGGLRGTTNLSGTLSPLSHEGGGRVELTDLRIRLPDGSADVLPVEEVEIARLEFDYELGKELLSFSNIEIDVAEGQVQGEATVSLDELEFDAGFSVSEVLPARLLGEQFAGEGTLSGEADLAIPLDDWKDRSRWEVAANFAITSLEYADWKLTDIRTGDVTLDQGTLKISGFTAALDEQPMSLTLTFGVEPPYPIDARYDLTQLSLKNLNTLPQLSELPYAVDGELSIRGDVTGTLQPLALNAGGRIDGTHLRVNGHQIDQLQTDYKLTPDSLALSEIEAALHGGRVTGEAQLSMKPGPGGSTQLEWTDVAAGPALAGFLEQAVSTGGRSDGSLALNIPAGSLESPEEWEGSADFSIEDLQFYDWELQDVEPIRIVLEEGELTLRRLSASLDGEPVWAKLTVGVEAPWPIEGRFELNKLRLDRLGSLPQFATLKDRVSGAVSISGQARGQLSPLTMSGDGSVKADSLTYDRYTIDQILVEYELEDQTLRLAGLDASAWGGRLTGTADIPLTPQMAGAADLQLQGLNIARLLRDALQPSIAVEGTANGRLQLKIESGQLRNPERWNLTAAAEIPKLTAQNIEVASFQAEATQQNGRLKYEASGRVFDGPLHIEGTRAGAWITEDGLIDPGEGGLTLQEADLGAIVRILSPASGDSLRALLDLTGSWNPTPDGLVWNADASVAEVSSAGSVVAQGLSLKLEGLNQRVRLEELTGSLAGGRLTATADADLSGDRPMRVQLNLRRAEIEQLTQLDPGLSEAPVQGLLDLNLSGEVGTTVRLRGNATGLDGRVSGLPYRSARIPITLDWHPESGHLRLQSARGHVSLPSGRMTGTLKLRAGAGFTIDGDYRFHDVGLDTLLRQFGSTGTQVARGRASGSLTISGRNVRSVDDLDVRLIADLKDARPVNMPVLSQMRSLIPGAAASGATRFREGRLEARLRGEVIEINRLSLSSPQLQVYVSGVVNRNGRLNLDAVVSSGQAENPVLAQLLLKRLVAASAPPVGALLLANDYLANRVVHLTIRGTVRQPIVQVKPFESLGDEAVRFFLRESIGVSG